MKKVCAVLLTVVFALQGSGFLFANEMSCCKDGANKWQDKRVENLTKELGLNSEQKDKISAVLKENCTKMKAEMEKMQAAKKAMMEEENQNIKAVLTPDQVKKFDELNAKREKKMEKKMNKMHKKCKAE